MSEIYLFSTSLESQIEFYEGKIRIFLPLIDVLDDIATEGVSIIGAP